MDGSFEFPTVGHQHQPHAVKSYFQSSFARSLSFNTNQSQSLDFELSFRIAGKSPDDQSTNDPPSPDAVGDDTMVLTGADSTPPPTPPPALPTSSPPSTPASSTDDNTLLLLSPTAATSTPAAGAPLLTPKQKNGRIYLPSSTPKRRYTTMSNMRSHQDIIMVQSKSSVSAEIEVLRLRQECQSLIEDNRRLITAADRQARANPSMIAADHQLYHHHQQLQQRPHRHQAQPPSATRVGGVSGGGSSVCTGGCGTSASTVETVVLQTQIDTLQWQLKQVESSRQMYHAVMEEVVRFLDRCHHTLTACPTAAKTASMARSKSVNQVFVPNDTSSLLNEPIRAPRQRTSTRYSVIGEPRGGGGGGNGKHSHNPTLLMMSSLDENLDMSVVTGRVSEPFANYKDLTWRRSPNNHSAVNAADNPQCDPAKLSQEAFRLLRTAQNLLNLKEPVLAESKPLASASSSNNADPLEQTVRCTTPSAPHMQRQVNCRESRLSMQSSTDDSVHSSSSSSRHETDEELLLGFVNNKVSPSAPFNLQTSASNASSSSSTSCSSTALSHNHHPHRKGVIKSSAASGSADDESGFSSMSSFQDVGLPMHMPAGSTQPPQLPPRSRLSTASILSSNPTQHNSTDEDSVSISGRSCTAVLMRHAAANNGGQPPARPLSISHRRWTSAPAPPVPPKRNLSTFTGEATGEPLKVLWV